MIDLQGLEERLMAGGEPLSEEEALTLIALPDADPLTLAALAHRVRLAYCGDTVE